LIILAAVLSLVGCAGHELNRKDYSEDAIQWGPPVGDLQVGLARRTYEPGRSPSLRQVYFTVELKNSGARPLSILAPTAIAGTIPEEPTGKESVAVRVTYQNAKGTGTADFKPAKKPVVQIMEPGRSYRLEIRLAPSKFGLDEFTPGTLTALYLNHQATIQYESMNNKPTPVWTGEASSGPVPLDVPPQPVQQQGSGGATAK
jgi:hypothetical protein